METCSKIDPRDEPCMPIFLNDSTMKSIFDQNHVLLLMAYLTVNMSVFVILGRKTSGDEIFL